MKKLFTLLTLVTAIVAVGCSNNEKNLEKEPVVKQGDGPVMLLIMDGWGIEGVDYSSKNAVLFAETPNYDRYLKEFPSTELEAAGEYVGLFDGQMGSSNVGHLTIGAGRVINQALVQITKDFDNNVIIEKEEIRSNVLKAVEEGKAVHLAGLISDGGIHSHIDHLTSLIGVVKELGAKEVYLHLITDGRDVAPQSALEYIAKVEEAIATYGVGEIATIGGRQYAMDRNKNWERTKLGFDSIVNGGGEKGRSAVEVVENAYANGLNDQLILPTTIVREDGEPVGTMEDGDTVIFFNFRKDRAIQISTAINNDEFEYFDRGDHPKVNYVMFTNYHPSIDADVVYKDVKHVNTLGEVVASEGLKQLRSAETEKYKHVTLFFNGGEEVQFEGEDRILIESPDVETYDLKPEMSAYELTAAIEAELEKDMYDFVVINFANPDMVGHTGNFEATVEAVEITDELVGRLTEKVLEKNGVVLLTSDHGKAEVMEDRENGGAWTAHTSNRVPFILIGNEYTNVDLTEGSLADIAPTVLEVLGVEKPEEMTGTSLIK